MNNIRRGNISSKRSLIASCVLWPIMFGLACWLDPLWEYPLVAEFLKAYGVTLTTPVALCAGLNGYGWLLSRHQRLNKHLFDRNQVDISRFELLCALQDRIESGTTRYPGALSYVQEEKRIISRRLGFLVEAEDTYEKLDTLNAVLRPARAFIKWLDKHHS